MKININYDLLDKVREAKTGISLRKYARVIGLTGGILAPTRTLGGQLGGESLEETLLGVAYCLTLCITQTALNAWGFSKTNKQRAMIQLRDLSKKLSDICIETDSELLKGSYQYDIEYGFNFESFPPTVEQKKYIMVPVHNDWGNNGRSLVQEHIIGSNIFSLSYGEPEKNKVYSYGTKKMISK